MKSTKTRIRWFTSPANPSTSSFQTPASVPYAFPVLDYKRHPTPYQVSLCNTMEALENDIQYYIHEAQKEESRFTSVDSSAISQKTPPVPSLFRRCVSLDIEWSPGNHRTTAMLQIANDERISLFHLSHFNAFPKPLTQFLEDRRIIKSGVNIAGDATRLYKEHGIRMESYLELQDLAKKLENPVQSKRASLQRMCLHYLDRYLDKNVPFTFHYHWTRPHLSQAHIDYAANDAYALYWVLQALLAQMNWNESIRLPLRSYERDGLPNLKS